MVCCGMTELRNFGQGLNYMAPTTSLRGHTDLCSKVWIIYKKSWFFLPHYRPFLLNVTKQYIIMLCTKFSLDICTKWPISVIHYLCCFDTIAV